ncbi:hypothetical protein HDU96_003509, partial [Phlyctochytrium bullatum]
MKFLPLALFTLAASVSAAPRRSDQNGGSAGIAQGECSMVRKMNFIVRGNEARFGADNNQIALNPGVVVDQLCMNVPNQKCKDACFKAGQELLAKNLKGFSNEPDNGRSLKNAQATDAFNAALGNPTNNAANFAGNGGNTGGNTGGNNFQNGGNNGGNNLQNGQNGGNNG